MADIGVDDKLLIGILRRKMKEGYNKSDLIILVSGLCEILERGLKKWIV